MSVSLDDFTRSCARPSLSGSVAHLLVAFVIACSATCFAREWTDSTGKFHREGEFVRWEDGNVWLMANDRTRIKIPFNRLSKVDQEFINAEIDKVPMPTSNAAPSQSTGIFKLANFQPGEQPRAQSTDRAPPWKYIYHCCGLRAHLIGWTGTINYSLRCDDWLALLLYLHGPNPGDPYRYYVPFFGDPTTKQWAFAVNPHGCGCCSYVVWRSDGVKWRIHSYACRHHAN